MAAILIIKQPKGDNFGSQLNELLEILNYLENKNTENNIVFNFAKIDFVHPLFILSISALISQLIKDGKKITLSNAFPGGCKGYLEIIRFPNGLKPDKETRWENKLNKYRNKNYVPIINFSTLENRSDIIVRNNVLSTLNQLLFHKLKLNSNYKSAISYLISEISENIIEHSGVDRGWVIAQYYPNKQFLDICIIDTGKTILGSYKEHEFHKIKNDIQAIRKAITGLSTKGEGRGKGIPTSMDMIINGLNGNFIICSGNGLLYNKKLITLHTRWNGTIIALRIPKNVRNFNYLKYV